MLLRGEYAKSIYSSSSQPGVCKLLGLCEKITGGMPSFKNHTKQVYLGRIFDMGVHKGGTILIWGYASTKRLRTPDLKQYITKDIITEVAIQCNAWQYLATKYIKKYQIWLTNFLKKPKNFISEHTKFANSVLDSIARKDTDYGASPYEYPFPKRHGIILVCMFFSFKYTVGAA